MIIPISGPPTVRRIQTEKNQDMIAIHITHEAQRKYGGIGAVINGLVPAADYGRIFERTMVYGPLFETEGPLTDRLGEEGEVLYSGPEGYDPAGMGRLLAPIEARYGIGLVYGRRTVFSELSPDRGREAEVVLADTRFARAGAVEEIKDLFRDRFGLDSGNFQDWDYEQYLRLAIPYPDLLAALCPETRAVHLAHEYMGLPAVLRVAAGRAQGLRPGDRTFYYAHEVPPARSMVENLAGHEIAFDNLMELGLDQGRTLEDDLGSQAHSYRAELVKRAHWLDGILAVSDSVRNQLLYFWPDLGSTRIEVVYNGFNYKPLDWEVKLECRRLIRDYCQTLLNYRPQVIITHVTRLVVSKGLWRDLTLLYHLDEHLAQRGLTGFYLLLATLIASGRPRAEISRMEYEYGWPLLHQEGWPDLEGEERNIYRYLTLFNARSRAIKGVFLNQFGFDRESCGLRVPPGADRLTLRAAADTELGLSVYEPFGISQLETYAYGGLPVVSRACGCSFLLEETAPAGTYAILDFAHPGDGGVDLTDRRRLTSMTREERDAIEKTVISGQAPTLGRLLGLREREARFRAMGEAAAEMGWERMAGRVAATVGKVV